MGKREGGRWLAGWLAGAIAGWLGWLFVTAHKQNNEIYIKHVIFPKSLESYKIITKSANHCMITHFATKGRVTVGLLVLRFLRKTAKYLMHFCMLHRQLVVSSIRRAAVTNASELDAGGSYELDLIWQT